MHLSSNNKTTPQFFSWPPEAGSKGESVAIDCTKVHKTFLSVYIIVYRYADVLRSTYQILGPHITGVIIQLISVPRFSLSATTGFSVLAFFEVNSSWVQKVQKKMLMLVVQMIAACTQKAIMFWKMQNSRGKKRERAGSLRGFVLHTACVYQSLRREVSPFSQC